MTDALLRVEGLVKDFAGRRSFLDWLRRHVPELRVRVVNVVDLMTLPSPDIHPPSLVATSEAWKLSRSPASFSIFTLGTPDGASQSRPECSAS